MVNAISVKKIAWAVGLLAAALLGAAMLSLALGSVEVPIVELVKILSGRTQEVSDDLAAIVLGVRLPRVLLGMLVGAGLATAGAAFQALFRNPLAEPFVLGISSGASFGTILVTTWLARYESQQFVAQWAQPAAAFLGALLTITLVYLIAGGPGNSSSQRMLLSGVIMASFLSSINIFLLIVSGQVELRGFFFWLTGDLSRPVSSLLPLVASVVTISWILLFTLSRGLNLISVSDEDALALGVNVNFVRTAVYLLASLITGVVVSVSGPIAWIGLMIPHIVRLAFGSDHRILLPAVFFIGAIFTLMADLLARMLLRPTELPVGVVTAICGAPFFIYLLHKRRTQ